MSNGKEISQITSLQIDLDDLYRMIAEARRFIILTHHNPDADAIGSSYALADYLISKGKLVRSFIPGRYPSNLEFLNPGNLITSYNELQHNMHFDEADIIFILDLNAPNRLNDIEEICLGSKAKKILIDHHLEPKHFCDYYFIDTDVTATGVLIFDLIKNDEEFKGFTKSQADALYTAIMTDTGSFRFPKTDSDTHRLIAELIDSGAEPFRLYDEVYNQFPLSSLSLKARAYSNIEIYLDGRFCLTTISAKDFMETGALEEETESIVESLLSVKGIYFAGLLIESPESGHIRCSFRAKNGYEVRSLAIAFGGGGHEQAAGARVKNKSLNDVRQDVINYVHQYYK